VHVVATAGHVDHGKSTLVRALTGMEPDRFEEERRRGLTIELGYAWTTLNGGEDTIAFVDVPGHERFFATMLAGLGPAPAVLFVVAADEGWRQQSSEHLAAVDALGLRHGLLVVTRSDLANPAAATEEAQARIAESSLGAVPAVAVSGVTGAGLGDLRTALGRLAAELPAPLTDGRVRLWVDRSFTIRGAGTAVTGTLGAGTLQVGDTLLTPGAWRSTATIDVRATVRDRELRDLTGDLVLHLGTAAVPVRLRPLDAEMARLTLAAPLPVEPGDRLVLRDPGRHAVALGAVVLDADPPELRRRGAGAARAEALRTAYADPSAVLAEHVRRRGAVRPAELEAIGVSTADRAAGDVVDDWLVDRERWAAWQQQLRSLVDEQAAADPLDP